MNGRPVASRSLAVDATTLAVGTILAALLAYGLLLTFTRGLGDADAAPVVLIWNYWLLATAALGAPVQQWITRNSVVGVAHREERSTLFALTLCVAGCAAAVVAVSKVLGEQLFGSASWAFPVALGLVTIGAWFLGVWRGQLAASGRYAVLAASWPTENLIRLVAALVLLAVGADQRAVALAIPVGYAVLLAGPFFPRSRSSTAETSAEGGILGALTLLSLVTQILFAAVPYVLALSGGSAAAVTGAFAIVAVVRIPNLLTSAMSVRILESMTDVAYTRPSDTAMVRRRIGLVAVPTAVVGAIFFGSIGRHWVAALFGLEEPYPALAAAIVALAALLGAAALLLALSRIAEGATRPVVLSGLAAVGTGAVLTLVPLEPQLRAAVAFACAECVLFAGLLVPSRVGKLPTSWHS